MLKTPGTSSSQNILRQNAGLVLLSPCHFPLFIWDLWANHTMDKASSPWEVSGIAQNSMSVKKNQKRNHSHLIVSLAPRVKGNQ